MLFVFIGGASASGKTLLASMLVEQLNSNGIKAIKISMDNYYKTDIDLKKTGSLNYDTPAAFDHQLLRTHLKKLELQEAIEQPLYSFVTSDRLEDTVTVDPHDTRVVVIEGILALHDLPSFKLNDTLSIFVTSDQYTYYIQRRCDRDEKERNSPPKETRRYELKQGVRDAFFKHILPTSHNADITVINNYRVINGKEIDRDDLNKAINPIISRIDNRLTTNCASF